MHPIHVAGMLIPSDLSQAGPSVAVVMPSFNSARYIGAALDSVLRQTYRNFSVVVVDGGSSDNTRQVVESIAAQHPMVRWIENKDDQGPAHARAVGIAHVRREGVAKFLAFLDADDLWLPEKLATQVEFMTRTGEQFCYTRYRIISEDGAQVGCLVPMRRWYDFKKALRHRGIGTLTVMMDLALLTDDVIRVWRRAGGEELLWWLLIFRKGVTGRLLDHDLARYRDTVGSLSKNLTYTLKSVWSMYRVDLQLPLPAAVFDYFSYFIDSVLRKLRLIACRRMVALKEAVQ